MATYKFHRWDNALKQCMDAKKKGGKDVVSNRWRGDPLALNQEAHELPAEKQRQALDFAEELPGDMRTTLAQMWKYCFVQWHIYDAGLEALEKGIPLREGFSDESLQKDIGSLKALLESGELSKATTAEKWTWKMLEPSPAAGSADPWNDNSAVPLLQAGRQERHDGVVAFYEGHFERALFHFWQGLKFIAPAPTLIGPHTRLRCDLYKNKAAAALKLKLGRMALRAASFAVSIDRDDPKAWYRKSRALDLLGQCEEARGALVKAGLAGPASTKADAMPPGVLSSTPVTHRRGGHSWHEDGELPPRHHATLESIVFIEVGVDSVVAIDMIRHIQSELPELPLPLTLVFDCHTVEHVTSELLRKLNAEPQDDAFMRLKMNNTVWRAMCRALGADPVQGILDGRLGHADDLHMSEQAATEVLLELQRAYEEEAFVRSVRHLARHAAFEQRAFLVGLRPLAMQVQRPILEARGLEGDAEGLRRLEASVLAAATRASTPALRQLLQAVRISQQGGPNGVMWTVNMETNEVEPWADCHSLQTWSRYVQADPFSADRKNTNSVLGIG